MNAQPNNSRRDRDSAFVLKVEPPRTHNFKVTWLERVIAFERGVAKWLKRLNRPATYMLIIGGVTWLILVRLVLWAAFDVREW